MTQIIIPIEADVYFSHKQNGGSGELILYTLNTDYNNNIIIKEHNNGIKHDFILYQTLNKQHNMGSLFLAQGGSSVAFVIKDDKGKKLVFKTAVFKKNVDN